MGTRSEWKLSLVGNPREHAYVNHRWLGGMPVTGTISRALSAEGTRQIDFDDVAGSRYARRAAHLCVASSKLEKTLGGITSLSKVPSLLWVEGHLAVNEAQKLGIPVVAIPRHQHDFDEVAFRSPVAMTSAPSTCSPRVIADAVAASLIERNAKKSSRLEAAESPWRLGAQAPGCLRLHRLKGSYFLSPLSFMLCGPHRRDRSDSPP